MTLEQLIQKTERKLRAARLHYGHGTDNPRDEAAFLVLRGLKFPFDADLSADVDPKRVDQLLKRRIKKHIPAAYLLNEAWLDGMSFYVDRRVIIPRSHIAFVLKDLRIAPRRILDICTGSGCLAILAARAFPRAQVDASDISRAALAVAARNIGTHRLKRRVRLIRSDLFGSIRGRYDLITCNPPYVSTPSMRALPREYRYEPGIALSGGRQGLDYIARILDESMRFLNRGGLLVCEVGDNKPALERAYPRTPFIWPLPQVFMLAPSRTAGASRRRPRRARGT
ncbi:MAG TPA: 50S ribosomal protein L3 N(5)-glutamine methyltransferase [Burkholderiales bacterium]|nr:50S ribosomal protein L3 N(5)-glutamine methyltransferase [Burkholderiales bacterium]